MLRVYGCLESEGLGCLEGWFRPGPPPPQDALIRALVVLNIGYLRYYRAWLGV